MEASYADPSGRRRASADRPRRLGAGGWRRRAAGFATWAPAAVAVILIVSAGLLAERLLGVLARMETRAQIQTEVDAIGLRLDTALGAQLRTLATLEGALDGAAAPFAEDFARLAAAASR